MKKNKVTLIIIAIILLAGLIIWYILHNKKEEDIRPVVEVEKVTTDDVKIYGEYVGRIRAQQFVEVRARVEGYLEKMLFDEGSVVEKGQPLFIINSALYKAKVDKAKAQLKKDEAQEAKAQRDVERLKPLYGRISERNADIGTLLGPNGKSLLATVVKSDTVLVDFSMTALDYLRSQQRNVRLGEQDTTRSWQPNVTITLADNSVYPFTGLVDFAEPQVDPKTGTFSVRAELPNPKQQLLPGQFTKVKLLLDIQEDAVVVPRKAVSIEKGGAYIWVMRSDETVEKRFIELGSELDNRIVVERGLGKKDIIVTEGYHKLSPGIKVHPIKAESKKNMSDSEGKKQ